MYFKTREVKEEDKENDYSDSNSSSDNEGVADQDEPGDDAVELMEIFETERAKVQVFYSKTYKCKMGTGEMVCSRWCHRVSKQLQWTIIRWTGPGHNGNHSELFKL